jgi:pimeloyl-ACP methyl ester carboxylesterase
MAAALTAWLRSHPYSELVFIGHSGGGALAMLLAERFPSTRGVLTVAGNLDPQQWVEWHGYLPLFGSLNPAERAPLLSTIRQLHYSGALDRNVPQQLVQAAVQRQHNAEFAVVQGFDHTCCWRDRWPSILARLRRILHESLVGGE